jgi:hypothetical protein
MGIEKEPSKFMPYEGEMLRNVEQEVKSLEERPVFLRFFGSTWKHDWIRVGHVELYKDGHVRRFENKNHELKEFEDMSEAHALAYLAVVLKEEKAEVFCTFDGTGWVTIITGYKSASSLLCHSPLESIFQAANMANWHLNDAIDIVDFKSFFGKKES